MTKPIAYTGGQIRLPNQGRALELNEWVYCNCCEQIGFISEIESGNYVFRYLVQWQNGTVNWVACDAIHPEHEQPPEPT